MQGQMCMLWAKLQYHGSCRQKAQIPQSGSEGQTGEMQDCMYNELRELSDLYQHG